MASPPISLAESDTVLFRPTKKRKIYRQRANEAEETSPATAVPPPPPAQSLDELIASTTNGTLDIQHVEMEGARVSVSEILRLRKMRRPKTGGVEFKASAALVKDQDGELVRDETSTELVSTDGSAVRKFAPQTGMVGDINKHM